MMKIFLLTIFTFVLGTTSHGEVIKTKNEFVEIDKLFDMTVPPKFSESNGSKENLLEMSKRKFKRISGDDIKRYDNVKELISLAHKANIVTDNLLDGLSRIAKFDSVATIRRVAMIGYISLQKDRERRDLLLKDISKTDGEIIFRTRQNPQGVINYAKFVRGREKKSLEDIFKFSDISIERQNVSIVENNSNQTLEVPVLVAKYSHGSKLVKSKFYKVFDERIAEIDSIIEQLVRNKEFSQEFVVSDIIRLENPIESTSDGALVAISNELSLNLPLEEVRGLLSFIDKTKVPHLTIKDLLYHKNLFRYETFKVTRTLYNGVSIPQREETALWAKDLLERNALGEEFDFSKIYQNAVLHECINSRESFECSRKLLN